MRKLTKYALKRPQIEVDLLTIGARDTAADSYRAAFYSLGKELAAQLRDEVGPLGSTLLACSSEDADWLSRGILDTLVQNDPRLAVFWNLRSSRFGDEELAIAPIIKSYLEPSTECETLIVTKSIIYTACVVRTNISHLIEKLNPKHIYILAPVMFEGAEDRLRQDFPEKVSSKFTFFYFAVDDESNSQGEVLPGVGGNVYARLGLGSSVDKMKYIPEIVKERRMAMST